MNEHVTGEKKERMTYKLRETRESHCPCRRPRVIIGSAQIAIQCFEVAHLLTPQHINSPGVNIYEAHKRVKFLVGNLPA